ncbi:MAG: DEAD/DEAH box helicase, partial [Firmicutes bacterium]|nr:DEAD/DEAH box helicase [Bacillota bacterium]
MSTTLTELELERTALHWLESLGYAIKPGPSLAPGEPGAERADYRQVVLEGRLRQALAELNPDLPREALEEAFRRLTRTEAPALVANNRAMHRMMVDGVTVEYRRPDGSIAGAQVRVIDFEHPENNDWLAVNQFTVCEDKHIRRPDIVLFVNGLPLVVIELKNPADEEATIWSAFRQLVTYKEEIPSLFAYNVALVISDGLEARIGTITSDRERFLPWRTIEGEELAPENMPQLEVLIRGVFEKRRLLDL